MWHKLFNRRSKTKTSYNGFYALSDGKTVYIGDAKNIRLGKGKNGTIIYNVIDKDGIVCLNGNYDYNNWNDISAKIENVAGSTISGMIADQLSPDYAKLHKSMYHPDKWNEVRKGMKGTSEPVAPVPTPKTPVKKQRTPRKKAELPTDAELMSSIPEKAITGRKNGTPYVPGKPSEERWTLPTNSQIKQVGPYEWVYTYRKDPRYVAKIVYLAKSNHCVSIDIFIEGKQVSEKGYDGDRPVRTKKRGRWTEVPLTMATIEQDLNSSAELLLNLHNHSSDVADYENAPVKKPAQSEIKKIYGGLGLITRKTSLRSAYKTVYGEDVDLPDEPIEQIVTQFAHDKNRIYWYHEVPPQKLIPILVCPFGIDPYSETRWDDLMEEIRSEDAPGTKYLKQIGDVGNCWEYTNPNHPDYRAVIVKNRNGYVVTDYVDNTKVGDYVLSGIKDLKDLESQIEVYIQDGWQKSKNRKRRERR